MFRIIWNLSPLKYKINIFFTICFILILLPLHASSLKILNHFCLSVLICFWLSFFFSHSFSPLSGSHLPSTLTFLTPISPCLFLSHSFSFSHAPHPHSLPLSLSSPLFVSVSIYLPPSFSISTPRHPYGLLITTTDTKAKLVGRCLLDPSSTGRRGNSSEAVVCSWSQVSLPK